MGHLSKIAQGVFIGNGEVWNFLDYAVNRDCGSLISYTQNRDFLRFNLFNNFNGGGVRRYYNSDIAPTVTYGPVIFSNLKGISNNAVNDDIGELYSATNEGNSTLKFISNDDFSSFQKTIRELQLLDYYKVIDNPKAKPEYYFLNITGEDYPVYSSRERGDEYNVPEIVSLKSPRHNLDETSEVLKEFALNKTKQIREKQKVSNSYTGFTVTPNYPVYQGKIGAKVNDRLDSIKRIVGLSEVADKIRNGSSTDKGSSMNKGSSTDNESFNGNITPLKNRITQNSFITNNESFHELYIHGMSKEKLKTYVRPTTTIEDLFSDGIDTNNVNKLVIRTNDGLYTYYEGARAKYASITIKPSTSIWHEYKSYGIEYGGYLGSEKYSVNNPHHANESFISSVFNSGGHVKHKNEVNTTSYTFFEEFNGSETLYNFEETSVADGSSVSLSDYSGASILLKKTNELFRNNKIKSLVNRFHTDTRDIDSEFITSFDNNFGLSRGRNLVKKQYSGKQSGDKKTGYDDPYCRVWTAHKQYSKLKDRIRPFVNDEGNPISLADTQSKYGDLRPKDGANRLSTNSVLKSDGYVNITSSHEGGEYKNYQKYMFSLENLAWKDAGKGALSEEQLGPKGGRIMWFPPYNLRFSENVSVNWNANSFIGRGEDIYSYVNTLRSGTLDFTLLIDHPSILNKYRGTSSMVDDKNEFEQDILRHFAGCGNLNDAINVSEEPEVVKEDEEPTQTPEMAPFSQKYAYVVFFPNNFSGYDYLNDTGKSEYKQYIDEGDEKALDKLNADFPNYKVTEEDFAEGGKYPTFKDGESVNLNDTAVYRVEAVVEEGIIIYDYYAKQEVGVAELTQLLTLYNKDTSYECSITDEKYKNQNVGNENKISYGVTPTDFEAIKENIFGSSNIEVFYFDKFLDIGENFKGDMIYGFPTSEYKIKNITFKGYASSHGAQNYNEELCIRRRDTLKKLLDEFCLSLNDSSIEYIYGDNEIIELSENVKSVNDNNAKFGRMAVMIIEVEQCEGNKAQSDVLVDGGTAESVDGAQLDSQNPQGKTDDNTNTFTQTLTITNKDYTYDNEYLYFSSLRSDSLEYKNIVDKVRFFEPAFHSITPEGFNSRLTFLHQCTRQGPTNAVSGGGVSRDSNDYLKFAGNLSFGRAPYCILRIGDFFNTKICIDSLSITYDNNGVQWDLNPEGAGVQPMFANISISFKFIGGQDISGPVERLQNAVTSNYYANASVYSRHADDENLYYDAIRNTYGNKV